MCKTVFLLICTAFLINCSTYEQESVVTSKIKENDTTQICSEDIQTKKKHCVPANSFDLRGDSRITKEEYDLLYKRILNDDFEGIYTDSSSDLKKCYKVEEFVNKFGQIKKRLMTLNQDLQFNRYYMGGEQKVGDDVWSDGFALISKSDEKEERAFFDTVMWENISDKPVLSGYILRDGDTEYNLNSWERSCNK